MSAAVAAGVATATVRISPSSDLWENSQTLQSLVKNVTVKQQLSELPALQRALTINRGSLINPLENPARNTAHRNLLKTAITQGIEFEGEASVKRKLEADFVDEALIISDLFELNEIKAAELLLAGEANRGRYPSWPRGLISVHLYYDAKVSFVHCLKLICRAVPGLTWVADVDDDVSSCLATFLDSLVEQDLVSKLIKTLKSLDILKEFEKLRQQRALGTSKHRKMVFDSVKSLQEGLADVLFCLACQRKLSARDGMLLVEYFKPTDELLDGASMTQSNLTVLFASLYAMDSEVEPAFIQSAHKYLLSCSTHGENTTVSYQTVLSVQYLAWAIMLRRSGNDNSFPDQLASLSLQDDDEYILEQALSSDVFLLFLTHCLSAERFYEESFVVKKFHQLITDFILLFPLKVRDLRNQSDEVAKTRAAYMQQGISPPADLRQDFENFMKLVSQFYLKETENLSVDYWKIGDSTLSPKKSFDFQQKYLALHKFLLISGDYIPALLYVPYMNMLRGLSSCKDSAYHCFNFLTSASQSPSQTVISMDHFFNALQMYYTHLRQERPSESRPGGVVQTTGPIPAYTRHSPSLIDPQEIQGLESVLQLLQTICTHCDAVTPALFENVSWKAIYTLFGLLSCKVPLSLKANVMKLISIFGENTKFSVTLWSLVDKYQLIDLSPSPSKLAITGVPCELEEFETKLGQYDLSLNFVKLIGNIITYCPRSYNLDLLQHFLVERLLNNFNTRTYKNSNDQYGVAKAVLDVILTVTEHYVPSASHFANPTFGFKILSLLYQDSTLTRKLLYIIDRAVGKLKDYLDDFETRSVVQLSLSCLSIIIKALQHQELFFNLSRESTKSQMFVGMDSLLLAVNPRCQMKDHLHNMMLLVLHSDLNRDLAIKATKILSLHAKLNSNQSRTLKFLCMDSGISSQVLQAFVEIVEDYECDYSSAHNFLEYLISLLELPGRNVAHFLLGFDMHHKSNNTSLQFPLNSVRNCLHAITLVLDQFLALSSPDFFTAKDSYFLRLAYRVIYKLCSNPDTSIPTLRFFQNLDSFLSRHLLGFNKLISSNVDGVNVDLQHAHAWIMKSVACDMRSSCIYQKRSNVTKLLTGLLEVPKKESSTTNSSFIGYSGFASAFQQDISVAADSTITKPWLINVFASDIDVTLQPQGTLSLNILDSGFVTQAFAFSETETTDGLVYFDVKLLHKMLVEEMPNVAAERRSHILDDIECVLEFARVDNMRKDLALSRHSMLSAWSQIVKIILASVPFDLLYTDSKQQVLLEILELLSHSVNVPEVVPELAVTMTGTMLSIISYFRQYLLHSVTSGLTENLSQSSAIQSANTNVLRNLIHFYIHGNAEMSENLQVNILSSILAFLRLFSTDSEFSPPEEVTFSKKHNWNIILSFGERFFKRIFSDCSVGHIVQKSASFCLLTELLCLDSQQLIVQCMITQGFLNKLIHDVSSDNNALIENLNNPEPCSAIFVINNVKFCLLAKLAQSPIGASSLVHSGFFDVLKNLSFIDARPLTASNIVHGVSEYYKQQLTAFRQVFMPLLECCHGILTTLSSTHREAASLSLEFIVKHLDVFMDVFHQRNFSTIDEAALKEINLCAGIVNFASVNGSLKVTGNETSGHLSEYLRKIHLQILKLLADFGNTDNWDTAVFNCGTVFEKDTVRNALIGILSYLLTYIKGHAVGSLDGKVASQILFFPSVVAPSSGSVESAKGQSWNQ